MSDGTFSAGDIAAAVDHAAAPASPAGTPSGATTGASPVSATATTGQAAADGSQTTTQTNLTPTAKPGEPPQEKWPTILDNARTKAAEEIRKQYAWADPIPEQYRQTVPQFYQLLDASPVDAIDLLFQQAAASPEHSVKLRSWLGRLLGTRSAPQTAALPEPDFEDQATGAKFFSAERLAERDTALEGRIRAALENKYGYLEQDFRTRQQREAYATLHHDSQAWADKEFARVSKYQHFTENQQAIAEAMVADESLTVQDAYIQVVIPKLSQQERSDVVASLHQKTGAASINPASTTTAALPPPKDFAEAIARQLA